MLDCDLVHGGLLRGSDGEQELTETGERSRHGRPHTDTKTVMEGRPVQVGRVALPQPLYPTQNTEKKEPKMGVSGAGFKSPCYSLTITTQESLCFRSFARERKMRPVLGAVGRIK